MHVAVQTPQYISRNRPSYGLQDTDGYSNGTHIICKFVRTSSPFTDPLVENDGRNLDGIDRSKFVNLKEPHYMYPIYSNQDLMTPQGIFSYGGVSNFFFRSIGMRIPVQDIAIVNNHPINFERRILPKSHPRAGALFAKIHGNLMI
jgi:hypothetical protein